MDYIVILFLTFFGIAKLISTGTASFYIPVRNARGFQFIYVFTNIIKYISENCFLGAVKQNLWKFKFTEHFGTLLGELFIGSSLNTDTIVFDSSASFKAPSPAASILMGHFLIGLYFPIFSLQHTKPSSPYLLSNFSLQPKSQSFNSKREPSPPRPTTALVQLHDKH